MPRLTMIAIQVLLLIGIAVMAATLIREMLQPEDLLRATTTADEPEGKIQTPASRRPSYASYRDIGQRNLFQTPSQRPPDQDDIDLSALKATELKLKLWGTITGPDVVKRAVIEDAAQRRQVILREDDEVASAKIKMILRDKVILAVNGEDQILEMEKPSSAPTRATMMNRRPPAEVRDPSRGGQVSIPSRPDPDSAKRPAMRIRVRADLLDQLSEAPENWTKFATVSPHQDDAGGAGLMFNRIAPSSPLRRLGIRNGDVLTSVNGEPVESLESLADFFQEGAEEEEVVVQLRRRGRTRELAFVFE
jgi:general secretion pathway protein C